MVAANVSDLCYLFDRIVSSAVNDILLRRLSDVEIKQATFQLGALKVLGPDGLPAMFCQKCWPEVGQDICRAMSSFFNGGFLLKELYQINIVLIPKVLHPETVS